MFIIIKTKSFLLILIMVVLLNTLSIPTVYAVISISAPADISIGTITGTGTATNSVTWNIDTDNVNGYKMEWQADAVTMASGADTIAAYTPAVADTPETWSVAAADSEWGARLSSTSTDTAAEWGTDASTEKWLNVVATPSLRQIVSRSSATSGLGSDQVIQFRVEVGNNHWQPTGTYTVNITITVTEL